MKKFRLLIGEHKLDLGTLNEHISKFLESEYSSYMCPETLSKPDIDIEVQTCSGQPTIDYKVEIITEENHIVYARSDYRLEVNKVFNQARIFALNELALKHALMNLYSIFITHHSWGLLVHSSCIEDLERTYLFAGHSGAGKSTIAKLSIPRNIWSDEATIMKIESDRIKVFNSPFRSDLKSFIPNSPPSLDLSGIYLIQQSLEVKSTKLRKTDALLQLMDKIFNWPFQSSETAKAFHLCKRVVELVPTYRLSFQKNNTFWELIS